MNMAGINALKTDARLLCVLMLEDVSHKDLPQKIMKIIKDQEHLYCTCYHFNKFPR